MSLFEEFMTPCVLVEKTRTPDGEGGFVTEWNETVEFNAAIVHDGTTAARVAEHEGMSSTYTITSAKNAPLEFHDVVKRISDGKYFRVTSDGTDEQTPDVATFSFSQVSAEEWQLS
jgi:hypothetical protein